MNSHIVIMFFFALFCGWCSGFMFGRTKGFNEGVSRAIDRLGIQPDGKDAK